MRRGQRGMQAQRTARVRIVIVKLQRRGWIQSGVDQTRLIALAAIVLGVVAIGMGALMRPKGMAK